MTAKRERDMLDKINICIEKAKRSLWWDDHNRGATPRESRWLIREAIPFLINEIQRLNGYARECERCESSLAKQARAWKIKAQEGGVTEEEFIQNCVLAMVATGPSWPSDDDWTELVRRALVAANALKAVGEKP